MKLKVFPPFEDRGEVVAAWREAQLIRFLRGKTELMGGSKEDLLAAQEWISLFWHEAVVGDPAIVVCAEAPARPVNRPAETRDTRPVTS
jgi:hypothetical protein